MRIFTQTNLWNYNMSTFASFFIFFCFMSRVYVTVITRQMSISSPVWNNNQNLLRVSCLWLPLPNSISWPADENHLIQITLTRYWQLGAALWLPGTRTLNDQDSVCDHLIRFYKLICMNCIPHVFVNILLKIWLLLVMRQQHIQFSLK